MRRKENDRTGGLRIEDGDRRGATHVTFTFEFRNPRLNQLPGPAGVWWYFGLLLRGLLGTAISIGPAASRGFNTWRRNMVRPSSVKKRSRRESLQAIATRKTYSPEVRHPKPGATQNAKGVWGMWAEPMRPADARCDSCRVVGEIPPCHGDAASSRRAFMFCCLCSPATTTEVSGNADSRKDSHPESGQDEVSQRQGRHRRIVSPRGHFLNQFQSPLFRDADGRLPFWHVIESLSVEQPSAF